MGEAPDPHIVDRIPQDYHQPASDDPVRAMLPSERVDDWKRAADDVNTWLISGLCAGKLSITEASVAAARVQSYRFRAVELQRSLEAMGVR